MRIHTRSLSLKLGLLATLALAGCDKTGAADLALEEDVPNPPEVTGSATAGQAKAVASIQAAKASPVAPDAQPPKHGQVLEYLPADCPTLRGYVDLRRLSKYQTIGAGLGAFASQAFTRTSADEKYLEPVLNELQKSGLKLSRDTGELATCVRSQNEWTSAVTLDTRNVRGDEKQLLHRAAAAAGMPNATLREKDGVSYVSIKSNGSALGLIAPGVLAYASDPTTLSKMAKKPGDPEAFSGLDDSLVGVRFRAGEHSGTLRLQSQGDEFHAELRVRLPASQLDAIRKDPQIYAAKLKSLLKSRLGSDAQAKLPTAAQLKQLASNLDQLDVVVRDDEVVAKVAVAKNLVRRSAIGAATLDPNGLEQLFL